MTTQELPEFTPVLTKELFAAAQTGNIVALLAALAAGADPAAKDHCQQTALHVAAEFGRTEVARILIEKLVEKGAEINPQNRWQQTPLHWAAQNGHIEVARLVIDNGKREDIDAKDYRHYTALHWAVEKDNINFARMLIEKGADIHARNKWQQTPLDFAIKGGYAPIVTMLEEAAKAQPVQTGPSVAKRLREKVAAGAEFIGSSV